MLPPDIGTTAAVEQYLGELARVDGDSGSPQIIRALVSRAIRRLQMLCTTLLFQSYPRLTKPPLNLQPEELLSEVVERLLKALQKTRPQNVRQFFGLANQHIRWELNDVARRLDEQARDFELVDAQAVAAANSDSSLGTNARRMLDAIDNLPDDEKEAFSLVRIQGLTHAEAAEVTGVSLKTIQRRLNRGRLLLVEALSDLQPADDLIGGRDLPEASHSD